MRNIITNQIRFLTVFLIVCSMLSARVYSVNERIFLNGISVKNFIEGKTADDLKGEIELVADSTYQISYVHSTGLFIIRLQSIEIDKVQKTAEKRLLGFLDITEIQGCNLAILEVVPAYFTEDRQVKEMKPSFCKINVDLNGDRAINTIDYALVIKKYGRLGKNIKEDLNGDEIVNSLDLSIILGKLGEKG